MRQVVPLGATVFVARVPAADSSNAPESGPLDVLDDGSEVVTGAKEFIFHGVIGG